MCVSLSLDYSPCVCVFLSVHTNTRTKALRATNEGRERESVKTEKKKTETTYKNLQNFGFHLLRRRFFSLASLSLSSGLVLLLLRDLVRISS